MQVICNGEEVLTVSGTKEKYVVDVWSGNHPFFKAGPPLSSILSSLGDRTFSVVCTAARFWAL